MLFILMVIIFYCRHLVQGILVKITAAASQITKRITIVVFVRQAIQVFIAREVSKTNIMLLSGDHFFFQFKQGCDISTIH